MHMMSTAETTCFSPVRQADILVAAVGCAEVVKADWVKLGATVVDVGINGS